MRGMYNERGQRSLAAYLLPWPVLGDTFSSGYIECDFHADFSIKSEGSPFLTQVL